MVKEYTMSKVAVVIPSYREKLFKESFLPSWKDLFKKHNVILVTVKDEKNPDKTFVEVDNKIRIGIKKIMGKNSDLISNRYAGVRSLGIAYVGLFLPEVDYILCLDDDLSPIGDSIQDHLDVLSTNVSVSWMAVGDAYTRGFPYGVRQEAEVVLSHGVWEGVPDFDAPTQLVNGVKSMVFYKMPIPKGALFPMCLMNTMFKRKMLPFMYMCPRVEDVIERCDDIWCGIEAKREIDKNGWAAVTGYSRVMHERASNVFSSLFKESRFIEFNEGYWKGEQTDPYFKIYHERRKRWKNLAWR